MRRVLPVLLLVLLIATALVSSPTANADVWCPVPGSGSVPRQAVPVGTTYCDDLRPGALIWIGSEDDRGMCTAGFLLRSTDGRRFLATAGHCLVASEHSETTFPGTKPRVLFYDVVADRFRTIGFGAYAVRRGPSDFGLIELLPGVKVNPVVIHWGGPVGTYTKHDPSPVVVRHFGNGQNVSFVAPARSGVAADTMDHRRVVFEGAVHDGDSGSPLMTSDGRAIGIVTFRGVEGSGGRVSAGTFAVRLDRFLPGAERALGTTLTLQTGPLKS